MRHYTHHCLRITCCRYNKDFQIWISFRTGELTTQSVNPKSSLQSNFLETPRNVSPIFSKNSFKIFASICVIAGGDLLFEVPYHVVNAHWLKSTEEMKLNLENHSNLGGGRKHIHQSELSDQGKGELYWSPKDIENNFFHYWHWGGIKCWTK